ncbi:low molecular weight phosphotyrosine protein phosphatase [Verrucomicrobia bacterium]|nr:low molecular weight phosphotyrosine protein phosphatase [Verrucomicrobiota bacterium]MDA7627668.1 low molecular weight phosphotyrosine protein phosphatase [Verrucomicrobiota bacterium]MDA7652894.1 low molecular weight phosphotyrosine protein phosphatase [bacterium]MDA7669521.1 low molecular weight phosphotyrosine protein phosphatase [bacterium]
MNSEPVKILFVCMGNICRSPAAEAVMQSKLRTMGSEHLIACDSAGTIDFHTGQPSDMRMRQSAAKRGYDMTSRARQITPSDLKHFDHILTMDDANYNEVMKIDPQGPFNQKVRPFCNYVSAFEESEVPDPYYGGLAGFDHVLNMLENGCDQLLKELNV